MADTSYAPHTNIPFAIRSALFAAVITAGAMLLANYIAPEEWKSLLTNVVGMSSIAFWAVFTGRLSGSDVLSEMGLNYPDLRPEASLHAELASLRGAVEALRERTR